VSGGTESLTSSFDVVLTRWENKRNEDPFIVIDTPGTMDSRNRDTKNIALMVDGLLEIGYVNAFLLVFNA